jgi:hypothetical protein
MFEILLAAYNIFRPSRVLLVIMGVLLAIDIVILVGRLLAAYALTGSPSY